MRLYPRTPWADEGKNLSWDDLNLVFALTMQWRSAPLSTTETTRERFNFGYWRTSSSAVTVAWFAVVAIRVASCPRDWISSLR